MYAWKTISTMRWCLVAVCLLQFAAPIVPASAQEKMYFSSISMIHRADVDGSNLETLYSQNQAAPWALALDIEARKIYWSDVATFEIRRSTLLGQDVEALVTGARPWGIALDTTNNRMCWTNNQDGVFSRGVYCSAMDGTSPELIVGTPVNATMGVGLDTVHGKIYWTITTGTPRLIRRANLDGTAIETIVEVPNGHTPVAIALDVADDRIYWSAFDTVTGLNGGSISRSRLDGTQIEVLSSPEKANGLALDLPRGHIYWTSFRNDIKRANLDGSGLVVMNINVDEVRGIAIDSRPAVKVPAASAWGLVALTLALATAGTVLLRRRHFG